MANSGFKPSQSIEFQYSCAYKFFRTFNTTKHIIELEINKQDGTLRAPRFLLLIFVQWNFLIFWSFKELTYLNEQFSLQEIESKKMFSQLNLHSTPPAPSTMRNRNLLCKVSISHLEKLTPSFKLIYYSTMFCSLKKLSKITFIHLNIYNNRKKLPIKFAPPLNPKKWKNQIQHLNIVKLNKNLITQNFLKMRLLPHEVNIRLGSIIIFVETQKRHTYRFCILLNIIILPNLLFYFVWEGPRFLKMFWYLLVPYT